jgi:hypothetical protein
VLLSCLHVWHQHLSGLCIAALLSEDLVNSLQSGRVVGTSFEIENLDLHFFQAFFVYQYHVVQDGVACTKES